MATTHYTTRHSPHSHLRPHIHHAHQQAMPTAILCLDSSAAFDSRPRDDMFATPTEHLRQYLSHTSPPDISTTDFAHEPMREVFNDAPPRIKAAWRLIDDAHRLALTTHSAHDAAYHTHSGTKGRRPSCRPLLQPLRGQHHLGDCSTCPTSRTGRLAGPRWALRPFGTHDLAATISYIDDLAMTLHLQTTTPWATPSAQPWQSDATSFTNTGVRPTTHKAKQSSSMHVRTDATFMRATTHYSPPRRAIRRLTSAFAPPTATSTQVPPYAQPAPYASRSGSKPANNTPLNVLRNMQLCHRAMVVGARATTQLLYVSESWTPKHAHDLKTAPACLHAIHLCRLGLTHVQAADAHLTNIHLLELSPASAQHQATDIPPPPCTPRFYTTSSIYLKPRRRRRWAILHAA